MSSLNRVSFMRIAIVFLSLIFSLHAYAYKEAPTQPFVLDFTHSTPIPDYSNCQTEFNTCAVGNYSSFTDTIFLIDTCGSTFYEIFSFDPADPLDCQSQDSSTVNCKTCECPNGELRINGDCVPDQQCMTGIQNYITGACWPDQCPDGDGTDQQCGRVLSCPDSENTTFIEQVLDPVNGIIPPSCKCTGGKDWNPNLESCEIPVCNGENNSPINSIFNTTSLTCACPDDFLLSEDGDVCYKPTCDEPDEIFVGSRLQCEVATSCPDKNDLLTFTNTCAPIPSLSNSNCGLIQFRDHTIAPYECVFYPNPATYPLPEGCIFHNYEVDAIIAADHGSVASCNQCNADNNFPSLE